MFEVLKSVLKHILDKFTYKTSGQFGSFFSYPQRNRYNIRSIYWDTPTPFTKLFSKPKTYKFSYSKKIFIQGDSFFFQISQYKEFLFSTLDLMIYLILL